MSSCVIGQYSMAWSDLSICVLDMTTNKNKILSGNQMLVFSTYIKECKRRYGASELSKYIAEALAYIG